MRSPHGFVVCAGLVLAGLAAPCGAAAPPAPGGRPLLEIEQKMPECLDPGAPFEVDIVVRNAGTGAAEEVVVTDTLPAGYEALDAVPAAERGRGAATWRRPRLEAGETWSLRVRLGPAGVEADAAPRNVVDAVFQTRGSSSAVGQLKRPELAVSAAPIDQTFTGQPIAVRVSIANKGTVPARAVGLRVLLGEGLTHPQGSDLETTLGVVKPGEIRELTLEVTASRAGDLHARLVVQGEGARAAEQDVVVHVEDNRLSVESKGPASLRKELTGLYELTVHNDGAARTGPVVLTVSLPEGIFFVRASDDGVYDPVTHTLRWELGDLPGGETRTVAWNGTARTAGEQRGVARALVGARTRHEVPWTTNVVQVKAASSTVAARGPKE